MNDYKVPDLPISTEETIEIPLSELSENSANIYSPERQMITQEEELKQIEILEKDWGFQLPLMKNVIIDLDKISPDRTHNPDLLCWKGFYWNKVRNPIPVITDCLHIMSHYCPSIITGTNNEGDKFMSYIPTKNMKMRNILKKSRHKVKIDNSHQMTEVMLWKDIMKFTNPSIGYSLPTVQFMDYLLTCKELSNFYLTIFIEKLNLKELMTSNSVSGNKEYNQLLKSSFISSIFDVFNIDKVDTYYPNHSNEEHKDFFSISKKFQDVIEESKLLFSHLVQYQKQIEEKTG